MFKAISFAAIVLVGAVSPMTGHAQSVVEDFRKQLEGYRSDIEVLRNEVAELRKELANTQSHSGKNEVTSIPEGAVVAFVHECPKDGWSPYFPAAGRFVIGAGPHGEGEARNLDANSQPLTIYNGPEDLSEETLRTPMASNTQGKVRAGGVEEVRMRIEHMPKHQHHIAVKENQSQKLNPNNAVSYHDLNIYLLKGSPNTANIGVTSSAGGTAKELASPHNNMPPYIALYFCKKEG